MVPILGIIDEHADAILDSIDIMAERVRRVGGTTIRGIGHISQRQTIEDDNTSMVPASFGS
jgi:starvation-inducible DNA-binding protein